MNDIINLLRSVSSANSAPSVLNNTESGPANPEAFVDMLEDLELQLEHAQSLAQDSPNVFLKASMNIAAVEMFSVLNRFDSATLSKRLEEKPELYFQLMNSQFGLMRAHLEQQKFEFRKQQAEAKQHEREHKLRAGKPVLITGSTLTTLTTELGYGRSVRDKASLPGKSFQAPGLNNDAFNPEHQSILAPSPNMHLSAMNEPNSVAPLSGTLSGLRTAENRPSNKPSAQSHPAAHDSRADGPPAVAAESFRTANTGTTDRLDLSGLPARIVTYDESLTEQPAEVDALASGSSSECAWSNAHSDQLVCSLP